MRKNLLKSTAAIALATALATVQALPAAAQERIDASGTLQRGDQTLDTGEFFDSYTLDVRAGDSIDLRAMSTEFDPYLIVRGPTDDVRWDNDDEDANSRAARIVETAPVGGRYRVIVTSYQPGESGRYDVRNGPQRQTGTRAPDFSRRNSFAPSRSTASTASHATQCDRCTCAPSTPASATASPNRINKLAVPSPVNTST